MPNWCINHLILSHQDLHKIMKIYRIAFKGGDLFNSILPIPKELENTEAVCTDTLTPQDAKLISKYGAKDWYDWCNTNWGTKWDAEWENRWGNDVTPIASPIKRGNKYEITMRFNTAWTPPFGVMDELVSTGFTVQLYYIEETTAYCGYYNNGVNEKWEDFIIDGVIDANIPRQLVQIFDIKKHLH